MSSLEQKRARHVLERARDIPADRAKRAPAMVRHNGLVQSVAFWREKSSEWETLNLALEDWLLRTAGGGTVPGLSGKTLLEALVNADTDTYRLATSEALAYLGWMKRLAPQAEEAGGSRGSP